MSVHHFSLPLASQDYGAAHACHGNRHSSVKSAFVSEKLRNINSFSASIGSGASQKNDAGRFQHATEAFACELHGTDAIRCRGRAVASADGEPLAGRPSGGAGPDGTAPPSRSGGCDPGAPTAAELAALAITQTDFIGDLDPATLAANAENSADLAAEIWSDEHGGPPMSLALIAAARRLLADRGYLLLCEREQAEIDALRDGVEAGDLDRAGAPIPYARYP